MTTPDVTGKAPVPPPEVREVSPGIYAYLQPDWRWGLNNTGFIVGADAVTVIDTCFTEGLTRRFLDHVAATTNRPIRTMVNTHHHGDHTLGNYLVPSATIISHERVRRHVQQVGLGIRPLFPGVEWGDLRVHPPFVTFEERINVYVDDLKLELIFVGPAHTPGDVAVWIPERRTLFAGDVLFKDCTPFVAEGSIGHYFETLATLRALGAETIVPGHGPVCGPEVLDEVEGYLRFVQQAAGPAFKEGLTPLEAARRTDLGPYAGWNESERIVGNIARAYSELRGEPWGEPLRDPTLMAQMVEYAGRPLHCP